jgi:hypothetical protein
MASPSKADKGKSNKRPKSFRMSQDAIEALEKLTIAVNKKSANPIRTITIVELIIMDACKKDANEILDLFKKSP